MVFIPQKLSDGILLQQLTNAYAAELFRLTDQNRRELKEWLPWLDYVTKPEDSAGFIEKQTIRAENGEALSLGIFLEGKLAGVLSFNEINQESKTGLIGYWLDKNSVGKGIVTRSVQALVDFGFERLSLKKIVIQCATENFRSQAIPKRLGFKEMGRLSKAENLYGKWVDHIVFELERPIY